MLGFYEQSMILHHSCWECLLEHSTWFMHCLSSDYEPVAINIFGNSLINFTITAKSDEITEAVENITLKYNSSITDYINRIEESGEFVRHTAIVNIINVGECTLNYNKCI